MYMPLLKLLSETILWTKSLPSRGLYLQLLPSSSQQEFIFKYGRSLIMASWNFLSLQPLSLQHVIINKIQTHKTIMHWIWVFKNWGFYIFPQLVSRHPSHNLYYHTMQCFKKQPQKNHRSRQIICTNLQETKK